MLLTIFILLQVIAIVSLILTFVVKTPLASAITLVIAAVLMFGAWQLNVGEEYVWDSSIRAYKTQTIYVDTPYLASLNMIIFGLSLLFFIYDMFVIIMDQQPNVAFSQGTPNKSEPGMSGFMSNNKKRF